MKLRNCIVKVLSSILGLVVVLDLLWVFGIGHALNKFLSGEIIEKKVNERTHVSANFNNFKYRAFPDFSLEISASKINLSQNNKIILAANNPKIRLYTLPLIFNKLYVNSIFADDIKLNIIREENGEFNIIKLFPNKLRNKEISNIKKLRANIKNYEITCQDPNLNYFLTIKGNYFNIKEFSAKKKINLNAQGEISSSQSTNSIAKFTIDIISTLPLEKNLTKSNFNFNLTLQNLDLAAFSPLTKYIKSSNIIALDGKINAEIKTKPDPKGKKIIGKIQSNNFNISENLPENSTYLKEKANIDFDTNLISNTLIINDFRLKTSYHDLKIAGKIEKINTKKPILDLKVKLFNDIKSMIYTLVPSEIEYENRMVSKIKKYKPKATVNGEITLKGDVLEPDIEGEFYTDNLFIDLPVANEARAKLKLVFLKNKLRILADVVPNSGTFVTVDGILNIYGEKSGIFDVKSGKNVKLTVTRAVLMPIQDTFRLNFGILNHLFVDKGAGDAQLHISGTRKNALVDGRLNFHNGTAFMEGINAQVNNVSGYLNFKGKNADFSTTNAVIKNDKVKIYGTADLLGAYDIKIDSNSIKTGTLLNILKTSPILKPLVEQVKEINLLKDVKGLSQVKLNVKGKMEDTKALVDLSTADYNGELQIKNNEASLNGFAFPVKMHTADITFAPQKIALKTNAQILNSLLNLDAKIKENTVNINANSKKIPIQDLIVIADKKGLSKKIFSGNFPSNALYATFSATYANNTRKIDPNKLVLNASVFCNAPKAYPQTTAQGTVIVKNGTADINKLHLNLLNSSVTINGKIKNIFAKKPDYNLDFNLKNVDISSLNNLSKYKILDSDIKKILNAYENYSGNVSGWLKLRKTGINGKLFVRNIRFTHKKMQMPLAISNMDMLFKNNSLFINSMNSSIDNVPVFMKLRVDNITLTPSIHGYITSNIYPSFVNKYINANLGYPLKLKGEMRIKSYFHGNFDTMKSSTTINLPAGSNLSYMGASFDEEDFEREIKADIIQNKNQINIVNSSFSKYISSQNGTMTKYPYINASGKIKIHPQLVTFNNLKIKTKAKTSSKFFNILFKKSVLKYGDFECNLNINGTSAAPQILGFIKFRNLDMPLYETVVKDIFADFTPNKIALKILGTVYDTNITAIATLDNRLKPPYRIKNANIKADYLNLDTIFDSMSKVTMHNPQTFRATTNNELFPYFNPSELLIDKGVISAKKIFIKGFPATDLQANFKQTADKILHIDNFDFTIAEGTISANGFYNFKDNVLSGDCIAKSIDANQFSQIFLNVKNQIYGALNGTVNFTTHGKTPTERFKNLNGTVTYQIKNGKMPKLGSLEYLLRAGNVIKSGLTGFTINNIIELLVPIKTGEFSTIQGNILVNNGFASDINLYTSGKNLSLYITGNSDLVGHNTKMIVYGRLSKKVSTLLGPIGNTSLNTLFKLIPGVKLTESENIILKNINKIPGLELSTDEYRFFSAEIDGDINGENYVKSFKWLE